MSDKILTKEQTADRTNIMTTCLVSSMEVLKKSFGFTQEQLQKFAEKYPDVLKKNLNNK